MTETSQDHDQITVCNSYVHHTKYFSPRKYCTYIRKAKMDLQSQSQFARLSRNNISLNSSARLAVLRRIDYRYIDYTNPNAQQFLILKCRKE